ncbi:Mannose-6-phosphate isomerase [Saitozyma podzolica]|uniref:Mannose-6-phosphate isomerase n=1 Tax=Saitozyma podzolica TaxID=1890683 RepID=A0A427Y7V4_9TREE|nr:Mannose-6-phosphate isomerase [Saitozyma podzolica]
MSAPVFKLVPGCQSYDWGKRGQASLAAQLASKSVPGFKVDESKPYAELWMGTHPTLPSKLEEGPLCSEHLKSNPHLTGESVTSAFPDSKEGSLPFLFKVLSIGTALSIQAHPDKPLAERLHKERPDVYKDPNHKPEMAIALTPFLAFLNFLPLPLVLLHLLTVPELEPLISQSLVDELAATLTLPSTRPADPFLFQPTASSPNHAQKEALKKVFGALMSAPADKVQKSISELVQRYKSKRDIAESEQGLVDLAIMLDEQYPGDVGVLCVFLLNVVELKKGEAAFLGADMPHAYISGDIIECMATSDNVVRAGLTPKLRDVDTLVSMLTYEAGPGSKQLLQPTKFGTDDSTLLYDPPIDEFSVLKLNLDGGEVTSHRAFAGPSLCIVTEGNGSVGWGEGDGEVAFEKGDVLFVAADKAVEWRAAGDKLELFRAFVEAAK